MPTRYIYGTEIKPDKQPDDTRIKLLPFANGHGRYITVTPERTLFRWGMVVTYNRYKPVTVSLLGRLCKGRFDYETALRWFQKRNGHLDPEVV
jgi:hypothetical protein